MQTALDHWSFVLRIRRLLVVAIHVVLIVSSNFIAFWLRFDGKIPTTEWQLCWQMIFWLVLIRGVIFIPFRLYEGLWRYTGIWDLRNIIAAISGSSLLFFGLVHWGFGFTLYPRSVVIIDSLLLIFFMGGIRLARRLYQATITVSSVSGC